MIIIPAIDMLGGEVVRLVRGEYESAYKVAADPLETALEFEAKGAVRLHMVDLDGAKNGLNDDKFLKALEKIASSTSLHIECGGGIRSVESAKRLLGSGADSVIFGSAAVKNKTLAEAAAKELGEAAIIGIDALDGVVATDGWTESSGINYIELAKKMAAVGIKNIIFTDISRDGAATGPNIEQLEPLNKLGINITASGGIRNIDDIIKLKKLGVYAAICGKSLYSGSLLLEEALLAAK